MTIRRRAAPLSCAQVQTLCLLLWLRLFPLCCKTHAGGKGSPDLFTLAKFLTPPIPKRPSESNTSPPLHPRGRFSVGRAKIPRDLDGFARRGNGTRIA